MKKIVPVSLLLICCLLLGALSGCAWVDKKRNELNPLYFLDGVLYNMELGPSELTINADGNVVDARIYLLAEGEETKSHYEITFHIGDDAAKVTDLKDAPFQGTYDGYLKPFRYALMCLIDTFPGKEMTVEYIPLGYNHNLADYDALYVHEGEYDFEKVDTLDGGRFQNYLEVTIGDRIYFVGLSWAEFSK